MEALVLGIGGMMPMPGRWLTSVMLRHNGRVTMFDCGEGAQVALKKSGFGIGQLERVVPSHLHGDHLLGIPGMLMLLAQAEPKHIVRIIGLPECTRFVRETRELLRFYLGYALDYVDLNPEGGSWKGEGFTLEYLPLKHSIRTLGFTYIEDERPGKFSIEQARRLDVPEGPLWGQLQHGEAVTVGDREIRPEDVLGPTRRGRKFAFVTDTAPCRNAYRLLEGADLALIEGMFIEEHATEAAEKLHLTAKQAGRIVRESGCRRALIGHVSPRYKHDDLGQLEDEARSQSDRIELARQLERYPVPLPD